MNIDVAIERAVELATAARSDSYAPYSGFNMGAGLVGMNGEEIRGVLIENVSLGLAMCSERVALFTAVVEKVRPRVLALCSKRTGTDLTYPCGACLQVALEIGGPELTIVAVDPDGDRQVVSLDSLLPEGPHRKSPNSTE
ncbi:MAG: cytidine deaminase [Acidimicrobiia bacterium]|nr:cytidine deaminase [Acidimicrobiia bacterium]